MDCFGGFVFVIYSCKNKLSFSEKIFDMLNGQLNNCKIYIIYGEPDMKEEYKIMNDKYLLLKVQDDYLNLNNKTKKLFNVLPNIFINYRGCFKCDDDIIPCISSINKNIEYLIENNINYAGNSLKLESGFTLCIKNEVSDYLKNNIQYFFRTNNNNIHYYLKKTTYVPGPFYYINKNTIELFDMLINMNSYDENIMSSEDNISNSDTVFNSCNLLFEDTMVGSILNNSNIHPTPMDLYTDFLHEKNRISFQNQNNNIKTLYVKIHGGLGNQLFQIASGYSIAKKHNKIFVIITNNDVGEYNHNSYLDVYKDTIFKNKNLLFVNEDKLDYNSLHVYSEINDENNCFVCNENIIQNNNVDYFLNGYFQNEKYFKQYKNEIIELFKCNNDTCENLTNKYPRLSSSFFIHVRRGDYLNNPLYIINYDTYYKLAIEYIKNKYPNPHFYILSNDIEFCKHNYFPFENINKTFIENEDTLSSLYIMSLCKLGGICANSSFSWWGSYLNENSEKNVVFPNKWMNNNKENDIYYENTTCINSSF